MGTLGNPVQPWDMDHLHAGACSIHDEFYCPPTVPLALRTSYKAGSRSTATWAAMLEGLLPHLTTAHRTLSAILESGGHGVIGRYIHDWISHEEARLGCTAGAELTGVSKAVQHFTFGRIGLPMSLCPTCCRSAAGRLRVVYLRNPYLRLTSYWEHWRRKECQSQWILCPYKSWSFRQYIEQILDPSPNRTLFNRDDLRHVAPTLEGPLEQLGSIAFRLEDPQGSIARIERALCAEPYLYCSPLPPFPRPSSDSPRSLNEVDWLPHMRALVEARYQHDLDACCSSGTLG